MGKVDKVRTKRNSRSVLKEYRSLARQNNVDAVTKANAIEEAIERLPVTSATILFLAYMDKRTWTSLDIAMELYLGEGTIYRYKSSALIEFAEAYHLSNLIVLKEEKENEK